VLKIPLGSWVMVIYRGTQEATPVAPNNLRRWSPPATGIFSPSESATQHMYKAARKQFSIKRTITINKSHCAKSQFHLHKLSLTWIFSRCTAIFCGFSCHYQGADEGVFHGRWAVGGVAIKLHPGSDFIAIFTSFSSSVANTLLLLADG